MYEFTHGGWWFRWSALDGHDKLLVLGSLGWSLPALLPVTVAAGDWSYRLGYTVGSGGRFAVTGSRLGFLLEPYAEILSVLAAMSLLISGFLWYRFSRRQDELFNRIQNNAIAWGSSVAVAVGTFWWMLWRSGWLSPVDFPVLLVLALVVLTVVWLRRVRQWV